ncbi:MAG TPA: hypothetical protein VFK33_16960 [Bacillales bacterium]|nr:hypothetical protein [Bacillales bacterium]
MKQVMQTLKRRDAERRIPVIRLEIDYELVTLHDAMVTKDTEAIEETKKRLEQLRKEWLRLEV